MWVVCISLTVFLSHCIHAPGAAYEIIIACIRGSVTRLIENSRSSPYFPTEWSHYSMTLQPCKSESESEPPPAAFTPAKSPQQTKKINMPTLPLLSTVQRVSLGEWKTLTRHKDRQQQTQYSSLAVVPAQNIYYSTHPPHACKIRDVTGLRHHLRKIMTSKNLAEGQKPYTGSSNELQGYKLILSCIASEG